MQLVTRAAIDFQSIGRDGHEAFGGLRLGLEENEHVHNGAIKF